ncbi:MAG: alpha-ribazole phosphatase [Bacillota bacterium]|jgi:alpha-ribazole phosphatase
MTLLYLIRHGETEFNAKKACYGWIDCSLNQKGFQQAQKVAELLKDVSFDVVISSPLKRARETAAIVSKVSSEEIILDERLKELNFGSWEGKHYQRIEQEDPENWRIWINNWKEAAPPGGESFKDMYRRVEESIKDILEKYADESLLLVSHQGCLRTIICVLLNMGYEGFMHFSFKQDTYSLLEVKNGFCVVKKIN